MLPGYGQAQSGAAVQGRVEATAEGGFARLAFTFAEEVKFDRTLANGVLVLSVKSPVDVDLSSLALAIPNYIVAARNGPEGTSLRIALARRLTVSALPAAERLFIDLLPEDWKGPLPELPKAVVKELADRAKEIERAKRRARNGVSTLSGVPLTLRIGRYPTFSRVVFEWNDAVQTTLSRTGNTVKIKFDRPGEVSLTRLNVDPPPNVRGARMITEDGRTEVEIDVAIGADVRGFRENTSYVLDIATDDGLGLEETANTSAGASLSPLPPVPTGDEEIRLSGQDDQKPDAGGGQAAAAAPADPVVPVDEAANTSSPAPVETKVAGSNDPATSTDDKKSTQDAKVSQSGDLEISVSPLVLGAEPPALAPATAPTPAPSTTPEAKNEAKISAVSEAAPPATLLKSETAGSSKASPQGASPTNSDAVTETSAAANSLGPETQITAKVQPTTQDPAIAAPTASSTEPEKANARKSSEGEELAMISPDTGQTPPSVSAPEVEGAASIPATSPAETPMESIFPDEENSGSGGLVLGGKNQKAKTPVQAKIVGETLRLTLPFGAPVAGAVFQRAQTLWMVFDTDANLDLAAIAEEGADRVDDVSMVTAGRMQVVKLKLKRRYLATAAPHQRDWVVSIGDLVLDPTTPISLERALRADGRSKVVAALPDNGHVHWISDSEVGDQLAVVTAFGPARGLIKRQEFVEFAALPTAHGLVIKPTADDVAVRIAYSDIVVTRDAGLTVSAGRWQGYVPGQKGTSDGTRPGFINFADWKQGDDNKYRFHVNRLEKALSELEPDKRSGARLELGRLFLAHQLGAEARGMMQLGVEDDPEIENDPVFRAMRGVANIYMNHLKEAETDFAVHGLSQDPHSSLWRGVIAAKRGDWRKAQMAFEDGSLALDAYPPVQQSLFRLEAARAALMSNDLENATRHIDALPNDDLGAHDARRARLLRGLLARALGDEAQALLLFREIENGPWGPEAAEAKFNRVSIEVQNGTLPSAEAIEDLETLAISWRGDDTELSVMKKLAELHAEAGNYLRGLGIMREAVIAHNGEERTRQIHEDMTRIFNRLFLEDGVADMKPLKALSLYYEFRELTPVGRRGDELIRKLARRLIEVDLLGQAADLLSHQVENRLTGAARAQVASDLSLIYLMDHKPELALRSIRRTRQAVLPGSLQQKRNTLEARALAELGRVEIAVELLDSMQGADIEELKSDALWRGKRWQDAGTQIEKMLGDAWQSEASFSDNDRLNVMRAGISYALANDKAGTERLRRKFISKMASSPDALSFDVVTKLGQEKSIEFNTLAAEISEIDTLSTFIENFRERYGEVGAKPLGETSDASAQNARQNG